METVITPAEFFSNSRSRGNSCRSERRGPRKEESQHRTVTIRQIWIASKAGPGLQRITRTLSQQADRRQPHGTADRFIVPCRGLNRAVEHQKYELRNDTASEIVIRPRRNGETADSPSQTGLNAFVPLTRQRKLAGPIPRPENSAMFESRSVMSRKPRCENAENVSFTTIRRLNDSTTLSGIVLRSARQFPPHRSSYN